MGRRACSRTGSGWNCGLASRALPICAGVYLLIAGTYTPVCLLVLGGAWRVVVLVLVCVGAGAAIVLEFAWVEAPKWVAAVLGTVLGWAGIAILPQLATRLNPAAVALLGVGGLAYTTGAIIYARRQPNPLPSVFGYQERRLARKLLQLDRNEQ